MINMVLVWNNLLYHCLLILILYPQFIDDPGLMNDEKLKPIQLPLGHLSSLKTNATCEWSSHLFLHKQHKWPSRLTVLQWFYNLFQSVVMSAGTENPRPSCSTSSKTELPKPVQPSLNKLLQDLKLSDKQELFFMQLPDCMPASGSAHSSDSSTLADRRKVHLHGQVSKRNLSLSVSLTYSGMRKFGHPWQLPLFLFTNHWAF